MNNEQIVTTIVVSTVAFVTIVTVAAIAIDWDKVVSKYFPSFNDKLIGKSTKR